jgi:transposase-like protein
VRTFLLQFQPAAGTADIFSRSIQMNDRVKRKALRDRIGELLRQVHRLLIARLSPESETFWERIQLASLVCPACGAQMALSMSIATPKPRQDQVFTCAPCGVSYLTQDYTPVNGRAII